MPQIVVYCTWPNLAKGIFEGAPPKTVCALQGLKRGPLKNCAPLSQSKAVSDSISSWTSNAW